MRAKTSGGGRAATSKKPPDPTARAIPLVSQDGDDAAVPTTSNEGDPDLPDVREVGSKGNVDNVTHESLGHNYNCIDVLDRNICICCNEGGDVLVCSERSCPVTVHAKCICCQPKFDDVGNFYCPYCWLKQALAEVQELRNKALLAKKDLSNFLDDSVTMRNKLAQKSGELKRIDPNELSLMGDGSCLDYRTMQGNDSVRRQPLQRVEDQQKEMEGVTASADQHEVAVEDETYANPQIANTGGSMHYREEKTREHMDRIDKSPIKEKVDVHKISKTHETISIGGKKGIEPDCSRYNDELEDEEEASPLCSCDLGKYKDGLSTDIAFVKETQENIAVSADNEDTGTDRENLLQNELKMPAKSISVSETNDSGSEAFLVKKRHVKQRALKYPQSGRNAEDENRCHENEEVTSSKTWRQAQVSTKQGLCKKLILPTGRRKRLRWTTEEEYTLKEGISRFSEENRNIPWRKILKFGCHVFDNTRTPSDLKDKWRTMTAEDGRGQT